ncbi:MAG TPA: peptidoglycan-binding domain-containing protein [Candidatus Paceibacterota bacterium]|nr:peptidoglycan-binding domain-containing protein [Candidatus Paceibacterota bacterium]
MQTVTTKAMAKVAAVATGLAMATSMLSLAPMAHAAALTSSQVQSILSLLSSFGADSTTIANVQASLTGGTPVSTGTTSTASACSFSKDLTEGSTGADVTCLQNALKAGGYMTANATGYFGALTKAGVVAWQKAAGVTPTAGYFGAKSRAAFNLGGSTTTTGGTTTGGTVSAGTGTGLKVSLSATSPSGTVLVQGQAIGDLADYVFANPTASPINVTNVSFNRIGVSNDSTLTNVYLYNNGTRLTDSAGVSNSAFTFSDPTALFTVPAGSTYTVSVRSDIDGSSQGQQLGVSLVSATSNGTLDSSVSFPINSGLQTISAATLATVNFVNANATPSATTISAQNDYPVWQDNVAVSTNPVKLTSMKFTNLGSADSSTIVNLRLYVDGVQVGSTIPAMGTDRSVTFDLTSSPVLLSTSSHVVKVLANITNAAASRTVLFSVQRSSDAMFVDSQLGQPVTSKSGNGTFSAVSTGSVAIQSASGAGVSTSLDPSSTNQNIAAGATSVKWASFDLLASGENVKVADLYVEASSTLSTGGVDGVGGLNNGMIKVNGVQVGSTHDIGQYSAAHTNKTDFSLGSSLILPAGQTTVVDIYGDAQDTSGANLHDSSTVQVYLVVGSNNGSGQSSLTTTNVPAATTGANSVTVSNSALTASQSTTYGAQSIVAGSNNAKVGSFALSTGATEGVTVNTIAISMSAANAASITNLTLKDHDTGTVLGTVIATPNGTASPAVGHNDNSFPVNLVIPASSSKTIDVYANVLSGANAGSIVLYVDSGTTGTGLITGQTPTAMTGLTTLQTITIGSGTLAVSKGAGDPVSNNVLAGASNVEVGQFNFSAANSSYTVQNLQILVPDGQKNDVSSVSVFYKDVNGATQTATAALVSGGAGNATATFQGLTMYVPSNDSANLDVKIGTPTIASNAKSGDAVQVSLDMGKTSGTFRAVDSAGTATTSLNGGAKVTAGGTFYIRKSIPTLAMIPSGATVPATGSPLYKFSITADPAGAVEWTQMAFNISTSSATVTNVYLTDDATGVSLLDASGVNQYASTSASVATTTLLYNNLGTATYAQVAAGATKTYDLYGTVTGFTTGSSITISLASDGTTATNASALTNIGNKMVWSDRSATSHSTSSSDWTNGYLLKNFTSSAITYSK